MAKKYDFQEPELSDVTDVLFDAGNGTIPGDALQAIAGHAQHPLQWVHERAVRKSRQNSESCKAFGRVKEPVYARGKRITFRHADRCKQESIAEFQKQEEKRRRQKAAIEEIRNATQEATVQDS